MKKNKLQVKLPGFTLIELLVVITIIGILATIVVVNLNSARGKGQDTAIKEQMSQIRSQGALYYDTQYGYTTGTQATAVAPGNCTSSSFPTGSFFQDTDFQRSVTGITRNAANAPTCYLGGNTTGKSQSWAMLAKMRLGAYWCVDSIGNSNEIAASSLTASSLEYSCPAS